MYFNRKKIIIPILLLAVFLVPNLAFGQIIKIKNPLTAKNLDELIQGIINFIFWIATAIFPLLIIIAAFYFMSSAGNPQQIATAKRIILYTVVGYGIILISKGLIIVIREILKVKVTP